MLEYFITMTLFRIAWADLPGFPLCRKDGFET
jgi:hypothetical protein